MIGVTVNKTSPAGTVVNSVTYPGGGTLVQISAGDVAAFASAAEDDAGNAFEGFIVINGGVLEIYSQAPTAGVYPDGTWRISVIGGEHAKDKKVAGVWTSHTLDDV